MALSASLLTSNFDLYYIALAARSVLHISLSKKNETHFMLVPEVLAGFRFNAFC